MKFLFAALLVPGLCLGAIWPENIGAWKRAATMQATLFDRPIWDEYGLKESEAARYENGDENFTVTGYRLQDTTGAMAAFDWQRPAKSTASRLAPLAADTGEGLLVVHGNYLLSFSGHKPEAAELGALFDGLRNVDTTVLPSLPGNLPAQDRVANSERYITGPASLAKFIPGIPPSVAAFHYGAEGQMGVFHSPKGDMGMVIFSYPTPQIAMQKEVDFRGIPGGNLVKRSGPLVAVVLAPTRPGRGRTVARAGEISGFGDPRSVGSQPQGQHRQPGDKRFRSHWDTARIYDRVGVGIWWLAGLPAARKSGRRGRRAHHPESWKMRGLINKPLFLLH